MQTLERMEFNSTEAASEAFSTSFAPVLVLPMVGPVLQAAMDGLVMPRSILHRSETSSGLQFSTVTPFDGFTFSSIRSGFVDVQSNREHEIRTDAGLAISASTVESLRLHPGTCFEGLTIPTAELIAAYERSTEREWPGAFEFAPKIDHRLVGLLQRGFGMLREGMESGFLADNPIATRSLEQALFDLALFSQSNSLTVSPTTPALAPRVVRRAMAYMEAHAASPITIVDVAVQIGVSVRALQTAFADHSGVTPSAFLRQVRLQGARADLLAGRARSVAGAAKAWGFVSLSSFARAYAGVFGELPSQTLRRFDP